MPPKRYIQYFLSRVVYSFRTELPAAEGVLAAISLLAVAAGAGAGSLAAGFAGRVGSFQDFSFVVLLYQYFFPVGY